VHFTTDALPPLRFPVSDLVLRALGRTGALDAATVRDAYRTGVPERLRVLRLRVPGYRQVEVAGHKRAYPPAA
jgi:hypothetical protein